MTNNREIKAYMSKEFYEALLCASGNLNMTHKQVAGICLGLGLSVLATAMNAIHSDPPSLLAAITADGVPVSRVAAGDDAQASHRP